MPEENETAAPTEMPDPQISVIPDESISSQTPDETAQETGNALPYVLGGAGVVAAAAVVYILIKRKKVN